MRRIRWWGGGVLLVIGLLLLGGGRVAVAEKVALVVGNGEYAERPLRRPPQDAQDMAALLKTLGFAVTVATDLDLGQMEDQVRAFIASARLAPVRLFYYSGHGANYQNQNYLLPIGHGVQRAYDLKRKAYPLDALLDGLREDAPGGSNVVLLDACRDAPFGSQSKSVGGGKGLIPVATAGSGTLVAYAAGAGEQAMELAGDRNSLFTKHLLQRLRERDDIRLVLTKVRAGVKAENPAQVTETSDKLDQPLYLAAVAGPEPVTTPPPPVADHDLIAWQSAEKCGTAACFQAYLDDYPNGRYAKMARARLKPEPTPTPAVTERPAAKPRPAETLLADRYRDHGDGTVTDVKTGLQWMRCSLGQTWQGGTCVGEAKAGSWQDALDAADALNRQGGYAGRQDWRVPTVEELLTLVYCSSGQPKTWNDTGKPCKGGYKSPTIYQSAFPRTRFESSQIWYCSASPYAPDARYVWGVPFDDGYGFAHPKNFGLAVRLVRGGP